MKPRRFEVAPTNGLSPFVSYSEMLHIYLLSLVGKAHSFHGVSRSEKMLCVFWFQVVLYRPDRRTAVT